MNDRMHEIYMRVQRGDQASKYFNEVLEIMLNTMSQLDPFEIGCFFIWLRKEDVFVHNSSTGGWVGVNDPVNIPTIKENEQFKNQKQRHLKYE
jgi:hypothetical protein